MSHEPARILKIACLGWGSLVWDPRDLPIQRVWFEDGPFAPVEFTRQSSDGRLTLVIHSGAVPVRLLWAYMLLSEPRDARKALSDREGTDLSNIGLWQLGEAAPEHIRDLPKWADAQDLDAAVWTALGPKFQGTNRSPSIDEVIEYLRGLSGSIRECAKEYIERAPRQIDTYYRRQIESTLGWSSKDDVGW
jgi:hypothetical protein